MGPVGAPSSTKAPLSSLNARTELIPAWASGPTKPRSPGEQRMPTTPAPLAKSTTRPRMVVLPRLCNVTVAV